MRQESRDALRENDADLTALLGIMHYPPGGTLPPPPPLPGGQVLAHNHVRHTPQARQGKRGFRF
jgi:hypothetical protein